jgi:hypothetical protein
LMASVIIALDSNNVARPLGRDIGGRPRKLDVVAARVRPAASLDRRHVRHHPTKSGVCYPSAPEPYIGYLLPRGCRLVAAVTSSNLAFARMILAAYSHKALYDAVSPLLLTSAKSGITRVRFGYPGSNAWRQRPFLLCFASRVDD